LQLLCYIYREREIVIYMIFFFSNANDDKVLREKK